PASRSRTCSSSPPSSPRRFPSTRTRCSSMPAAWAFTDMREPKEPSTRRQLVTIRKFLKVVHITFKERYAPKEDTSYFELEGPSELESFTLMHEPGLLTMYAVFGVKAPKKQHG